MASLNLGSELQSGANSVRTIAGPGREFTMSVFNNPAPEESEVGEDILVLVAIEASDV
jgi:hypothetical protein